MTRKPFIKMLKADQVEWHDSQRKVSQVDFEKSIELLLQASLRHQKGLQQKDRIPHTRRGFALWGFPPTWKMPGE
jgi:hypothetical protein